MNVKLYYEYEYFQVFLVVENEFGKKIRIKVVNFWEVKYFGYSNDSTLLTPNQITVGGTELMIELLRKKIKEIRKTLDVNTYSQNQENAFLNLSTNYIISKNDWDLLDDYYNN